MAHMALGHKPPSYPSLIAATVPGLGELIKRQSRKRETAADLKSALIAGETEGLISTLKLFRGDPRYSFLVARSSGFFSRVLNPGAYSPSHPDTSKRIKDLERFSATHAEELQASRSRLDALREKMKRDFTDAAHPAAPAERSPSLRASRGLPPALRHS